VFSRNIYCDEKEYWFGGLAETVWKDLKVEKRVRWENGDKIIEIDYDTRFGKLSERLRYDFAQSTLVQEKFLIHDYENQMDAFENLLASRSWKFRPEKYERMQQKVGNNGVVVAGELHSPLKMLHILAGPIATTYMLADYPDRMKRLLALHENAQLHLARQMTEAGVRVMMSMDNLDTMFHPPAYVEKYSASFYEKAAGLCHKKGAPFFVHACGKQKDNLALISSLGVDGLEGVAFPPLGDVELDEAMRKTDDAFLITGGISAMETDSLTTKHAIFEYVRGLLTRMKPYANRFIFSSSCNTAINAKWETIKYFRDAWMEFGAI
jgi:uroporphyrinogen-III decarboxylase